MTFEEELLQRIASTLGVPASALGEDYEAMLTPADKAYRRVVRFYEDMIAAEQALIRRSIAHAVFAAYIETAWDVQLLCGYNPHMLLTTGENR